MSRPSNRMRPLVGSAIRSTASPVVDLPQPLSPTRPRVSPRLRAKLTPSTALMVPTWRRMTAPFSSGKCTFRSSTRRISSGDAVTADDACATAALLSRDIMEAGLEMTVGDVDERRAAHVANIGGDAAAGREGAAERQLREVGRLALDRDERPSGVTIEARDG